MARLGVARERKPLEGRVALTPAACAALVTQGHEVLVEQGAGEQSGFADAAYSAVGAHVLTLEEVWSRAATLVKVKEPLADELQRLRPGQQLFCYLHLAANPELAQGLCRQGVRAYAFETVEDEGELPLLQPMSAIAGRLAAQVAAELLHAPRGGKGLLLGGLPGTPTGNALVIGAGQAGLHAAAGLAASGARVQVLDLKPRALEAASALGANVECRYSYPELVTELATRADVIIGAVLVPGARAPVVLGEEAVRAMEAGSVIVDIAVDQGGCVATTRPTDYRDPVYQVHGVSHFCVSNMPGAVPRTASEALSARLLPWLQRLLNDPEHQDLGLTTGLNVAEGRIIHPAVREALADQQCLR